MTADLATSASLVGLTLTTFFLGMALGQLLGGPLSDQRGRRMPMIVGGLICTLGAVGCAVAPSIGFLIVFRVVQGFGGGVAAVVARAVVVDVAKGDLLAKVMSIMMALGGLAPMVAPVVGGAVLTARRNLADGVLVSGRLRGADGDHRHRVRARVAAAGASARRRPASVRVGSEPGAADPVVRRLRADRGVVRLHDDGLHRELLLRAAGDEGPAAHAVRAVLRLHRAGPGVAVDRQRQDRRTVPAAHPHRVRAHPRHRRRRGPDRGRASRSTPRCCSPAPGSSS